MADSTAPADLTAEEANPTPFVDVPYAPVDPFEKETGRPSLEFFCTSGSLFLGQLRREVAQALEVPEEDLLVSASRPEPSAEVSEKNPLTLYVSSTSSDLDQGAVQEVLETHRPAPATMDLPSVDLDSLRTRLRAGEVLGNAELSAVLASLLE